MSPLKVGDSLPEGVKFEYVLPNPSCPSLILHSKKQS